MIRHDDINRRITVRIIDALESGAIPWRQPWVADPNAGVPCDLAGTEYRGVNALLLQMTASEFGFRSRWWAPFRKWRGLGCRLKPLPCGGTRIITQESGEGEIAEGLVMNAEQVQGLGVERYLVRGKGPAPVGWQRAERVVVASGADVRFVFGTYAAYHRPPQDFIVFPLKQQFVEGPGGLSGYYDSLFHELVHWSEPRLLWCPGGKWDGVTRYAVNELRAEMGAGWLAAALDIPASNMDRNHHKYLDCWLWALRQDPGLIFQVARGACSAVEYLLRSAERENERDDGDCRRSR